MPNPHLPRPPARPRAPAALHVVLEYLGFRNTRGRREYLMRVQSGSEARNYTVWIAHTAFAMHKALLQDGPDISFQKLQRELAEFALGGAACVGVTDGDLADYREAHAPPTRRPPLPRPPSPARSGWMTASAPPRRNGGT